MNDVQYLQNIYLPSEQVIAEGERLLRESIESSCAATRRAMLTNRRMRELFEPAYLELSGYWDLLVGHFVNERDWRKTAEKDLTARGCAAERITEFCAAAEKSPEFLREYHFLFGAK